MFPSLESTNTIHSNSCVPESVVLSYGPSSQSALMYSPSLDRELLMLMNMKHEPSDQKKEM